ncbi:MAG: hypothetical protein K2G38_00215 [Clostridia bacterium]|nr:hypothetical protein [Clostridia bacterium]
MNNLLPLERNAVLTEINKELAFSGGSYIVSRGLVVDKAASVYELMGYVYALFPDMDVPFCTVFEKVCDFVQGYVEHYDKLRAGEI